MYKMNKVLFIGVLFLSMQSQGQSIRGTVTDEETGLVIQGVRIQLSNTGIGTRSDIDGRFVVKNPPAGATTLRISSSRYTPVEILISQPDTLVTIVLKRSAIYLDDVVISAQRNEQHYFEVKEMISSVSEEDLQQTSPRSTPEALMGSTGVWVQKTNHGGGSPIIRGLVGNQVLLMIDGVRLNNTTYRYGPNQYLSTIDPGIIQRIEVTRGNGSVLYGSDALGGVVQVLSKTPLFTPKGIVIHGNVHGKWISSGMEKSGRAEVEIQSEKIGFIGGFSIRNFGDLLAGGSLGKLKPSGYSEMAGDLKMLYRVKSNGLLTAAYQHLVQNQVPRYDQVQQGGYKAYNFNPQIRQLAYVRWESYFKSQWVKTLRLTTSLNHSEERTNSQKNGSDEVKIQDDLISSTGLIAEIHSQPTSFWSGQSGVEFYHDDVTSSAKIRDTKTNEEIAVRGSYADGAISDNLAVFSHHIFDLKKIQLSLGGRLNAVTISVNDTTFGDQKISPQALVANAGVMYKIHANHHVIFSTNTGFRAPNVDDLSKFGAVESTVFEIPSSGLAPEKSFSVELGVKSTTNIISGSLSGYHTRLTNLIDRVATTFRGQDSIDNRKVYQKQNIGKSIIYGIEAETEIKLVSWLVLFANITYTHGENISKNEPARRIPPLFGRVGMRYNNTSGWWVKAECLAASQQNRLAAGDLSDSRISSRLIDGVMPGWNVINIFSGYKMKWLTISVCGQNLLNKNYRVYASGIDGYGRSLWISTTVNF